jgi:hypothetical protein
MGFDSLSEVGEPQRVLATVIHSTRAALNVEEGVKNPSW